MSIERWFDLVELQVAVRVSIQKTIFLSRVLFEG